VFKQIVELGTVTAATVPNYGDGTDIPCVVLHLPCYVCVLPPPRLLDFVPTWIRRSLSEACPNDFLGRPFDLWSLLVCAGGKGFKEIWKC
jgi:hypothetical protein